ncbi:type I restriction endonuclease subunit R [Globicatella sp. HMSC072A10]|uniref:type I restriction-modification system endonuclease n=1 Tax=Globicatella sp. HMSC072A10 TaxID=1739315 RepID=UPI0008CEF80B|nr:type I restriction-modification system endonuclease [Globicatella sp. HMSC072A10]OFK53696.1 type I restriction endonuclease subunit R [Globicatella sp. HMSC072A10]
MASNFNIFPEAYRLFENLGQAAERNVYSDPNTAVFKMRQFSEKMVDAICSLEAIYIDQRANQLDKLNELRNNYVLDGDIESVFHTIRKTGNRGVHDGDVETPEAMDLLRLTHYLSNWFMEVYVDYQFESQEFQIPENQDALKDQRIAELEAQLLEQEQDLNQQMALNLNDEANSNESVKKERRQRSRRYTDKRPPNEIETRILIDEQLRSAGWEVNTHELNYKTNHTMPEKNRQMAIAEWPCGSGFADYALFDGLELIGIIEAKPYGKDIAGDLQQAKRYAREVESHETVEFKGEWNGYHVPFVYSTNGRPYLEQLKEKSGIWFWDTRRDDVPSYALEQWHSPQDLRKKLEVNIEEAEKALEEDQDYPDFASRYYQIEAVQAVEESLANNQRRMLIAMATGTGKTRLALAIMYRLIKTKRVRRILFLVDRKSLGEQTADDLKDTKVDNLSLSDIYGVKEVTDRFPDDTTKIQISTVQGMVQRLFNQEDPEKIPSIGTYDFIIVDEAHRGYNEDRELSEDQLEYHDEKDYISQYRRVIDYFDADVLALTATPALHTTNIFGMPIYSYSYTDAVVDGYLVDHNPPYKFETELNRAGITIHKDEEITLWNPDEYEMDKALLEDDLHFDVAQFNKRIINESFNRVICEALVDCIDPTEPGKTLVFAATDYHADMLVRLLREAYSSRGYEVTEDMIMKITGANHDSSADIRRFKNEVYPNIVVTVDLLTTGINVPEIVNLVFVRKVRSRILYEQMLGRATRLCPEIDKEAFNIFDAVQLYDTLYDVTDMKPVAKTPKYTIEDIFQRTIEAETDEEFQFLRKELLSKLQRKKQRLDDKVLDEIRELNNTYSIDRWLHALKEMDQTSLVGEKEHIETLAVYRPSGKDIIISDEEDQLLAVERGFGEGNTKPKDYLQSFEGFIKENINKIPALSIAANRPADLTREELREVELILKKHRFDEKGLQEAWRKEKNEVVIANIISFIRQAAIGSPLVDNQTRIKEAMASIYAMHDWSSVQLKWLERIEKQLLKSPVLGPDAKSAFDDRGVFANQGGYKRVKQIFGDYTDEIVDTINDKLYG